MKTSPMTQTRIIIVVLAALVVAALAVGCGSDDTPTPPMATSTPTAQVTSMPTEASSTVTPPPTVAPATQAAPTPAPTAAATPEDTGEGDPSNAYFALDRVLDISIEIAPEDWDTLRHQTRTFEDLMAEIEEFGLSQPFADIYTWFLGTVTVDGETHSEVGVRKKGFLGSQSDTKPSLKLRYDKYVDDQALGGIMERMTLNNSIQDTSMVNTCLAYQVFAAAGSPSPRCNFATVSVNGKDLGIYVHVEEIKKPFLERRFDSAEGNLYEGTVSDFTPEYRGTFEKKTNEDANDWSDIDAVTAALQDPSEAGLEALAELVDLDRFLSFWSTEALVGHWDGYTGDRNNYQFYREPHGKFVFIPWGVDDTFHLRDDPNPFDHVTEPPPSVLALAAIPNRLYNNANWREKYVARLKELLDTVWNEEELLASLDEMSAIVQENALLGKGQERAADTDRVRKFILKRKGEILADLTPQPPEWPDAPGAAGPAGGGEPVLLEVDFETEFGTNQSANPLGEGEVTRLLLNEVEESVIGIAALAGYSSPEEQGLLPRVAKAVSVVIFGVEPDGSVNGMTLAISVDRLTDGATLVIGEDEIAGGVWSIPPGAPTPNSFLPFTEGRLQLQRAGAEEGSTISGSFSGVYGGSPPLSGVDESGVDKATPGVSSADVGLVINEVASKGDPLDWFELYNASDSRLALANFVVADDLNDAGKRVAFPGDLVIAPGEYLQVEMDKDGWPGFGLGGDEELGIWTADGMPVDSVDWDEGQAGEGESFARVPDRRGEFQTVNNPTPGAANEAGN